MGRVFCVKWDIYCSLYWLDTHLVSISRHSGIWHLLQCLYTSVFKSLSQLYEVIHWTKENVHVQIENWFWVLPTEKYSCQQKIRLSTKCLRRRHWSDADPCHVAIVVWCAASGQARSRRSCFPRTRDLGWHSVLVSHKQWSHSSQQTNIRCDVSNMFERLAEIVQNGEKFQSESEEPAVIQSFYLLRMRCL